eukprot:98434-Prymnesium_polylepis.1
MQGEPAGSSMSGGCASVVRLCVCVPRRGGRRLSSRAGWAAEQQLTAARGWRVVEGEGSEKFLMSRRNTSHPNSSTVVTALLRPALTTRSQLNSTQLISSQRLVTALLTLSPALTTPSLLPTCTCMHMCVCVCHAPDLGAVP